MAVISCWGIYQVYCEKTKKLAPAVVIMKNAQGNYFISDVINQHMAQKNVRYADFGAEEIGEFSINALAYYIVPEINIKGFICFLPDTDEKERFWKLFDHDRKSRCE